MKKKMLFVLLLVAIISVWYVEAEYGVSELVIEKISGKTPEAKIENYIRAVSSGNKEQALQ